MDKLNIDLFKHSKNLDKDIEKRIKFLDKSIEKHERKIEKKKYTLDSLLLEKQNYLNNRESQIAKIWLEKKASIFNNVSITIILFLSCIVALLLAITHLKFQYVSFIMTILTLFSITFAPNLFRTFVLNSSINKERYKLVQDIDVKEIEANILVKLSYFMIGADIIVLIFAFIKL